ncbi:MAG: diacylglycerol kinase family protein [Dermabacter sp.]|nr:diacylglycerol kinase family protein [Dermabacter sp.]
MRRLRVGLLANPAAANGSAHATGRYVSTLLTAAGLSVVDVSGPDAAVARARALDVVSTLTALVAVGGDGTVALGASIVAGTPVRLGIVAAGSGNDFARAIDLPIDEPDEAVRIIVEALSRPVQSVDAIEVTRENPDGSTSTCLALGNVALGFDALVNARANRSRYGYVGALLREVLHFTPRRYWMEVDGGPRERLRASLLTVCNTGVFGGGMRYSPSSDPRDGELELVSVAGVSRARLLGIFPRVFRGTHVRIPEFRVRRVHSVRVGLDEDRHFLAFSDGEARFALPVSATVCPGAVRILAPPPAT